MYIINTFFAPLYDGLLSVTSSATVFNVAGLLVVIVILPIVLRVTRSKLKATSLQGPPRTSLIYGASKEIFRSSNPGSMYEAWAKEYGAAYQVPLSLGGIKIMLCDPTALAHFFARDTSTYVQTDASRLFFRRNFGKGILWSRGEDHRRQRKLLTPAFSHAAICNINSVFYRSAHKTRAAWESLIEKGDGDSAIIEVQGWMNHISLDSIGLACFSHDFGSLEGKPASVAKAFDAFGTQSNTTAFDTAVFLLAQVFPIFAYLPTSRGSLYHEMKKIMIDICKTLLERTKKEKEDGALDGNEEKSIIGLLIKVEKLRLTPEEVVAQMRVLLLAAYETSSISMTWVLLELARNPDIQKKLREDLFTFGTEPTHDQLSSSFPYLDAVVHETLRMYPPLSDFVRVATQDDVIPLSKPVRDKTGELVDKISVACGTKIGVSASCMNRSAAIWGPDANEFRPERWLEANGIPKKVEEVQGHRHLLTFGDGPRSCLGKGFALAEIKVTLFVLVRNFVFEMKDGPDTKVEMSRGLLPRPRVVGEGGTRVPLRVSGCYEG